MRKFYSLVAFAAMMVLTLTANAQTYDLTEDNAVLQSEQYNMRLYKSYDFLSLTVNGVAVTPETLQLGSNDEDMPRTDGYAVQHVLNEGLENLFVGIGNIELNTSKGLYNNKNGVRYCGFTELKAGQIVVIQNSAANEKLLEPNDVNIHDYAVNACRIQKQSTDGTVPAWTVSYLSNNGYGDDIVEEITDEIHAIQDADVAEGEESVADSYRYFRVLTDGPLYIAMGKYCALQGVQIWIDAAADESVTAPGYKIVGVNGDARNVELTVGESTLGSVCSVTYGFMEDESATNEDYEYDPADGFFTVYASDDADGDGVVIVEAVTVAETGAKSEPVQFKINVGEIALNAPTLTLSGFNGEERIYTIGWENNTLCGEDFTIVFSADDGQKYNYFDPNLGVGENVVFAKEGTVKVSASGYTDGVVTVDAELTGVTISRKNADKAAEGAHDWDFVHLSAYQQALIKKDATVAEVVENCYITVDNGTEVPDTVYYSAAEYIDGAAEDGTDLSSATPVIKESGWWEFDSSRFRTSLKVIEGGNDQNADGYGYAEDVANIWDGLTISNPPYVNSRNEQTSSILLYINDDLGLYFGTKPVFTFPREAAAAGEYVLMYIGYGGSNYTNSRYPVIYQVPVGELLSVTLGNNPHVFYIDVYTYDNLPADEYDPTSVKAPMTSGIQKIAGYYSINGARLAAPQKGINIVKYADGTTMKVLVK